MHLKKSLKKHQFRAYSLLLGQGKSSNLKKGLREMLCCTVLCNVKAEI